MSTTTTNGSIDTNEKDLSTNSTARYQQLKQRKLNLEKKLGEKYELLHKLCQEEANLVGILTNNINTEEASTSVHNTLRRKVGTSFKSYIIPDSLLNINNNNNNDEDDINKLFLEKQIQQQISEASLRLSNDRSQTKPIRRTHKQSYEISQQKLVILNQNINLLTQRQPVSQDDINLHRNNNNHQKNLLLAATGNSSTLNNLNITNQMMFSERRNSMKSTTSSLGSGNTFFVQSPSSIKPTPSTSLTSLKPQAQNVRQRHDSCNNRLDYMVNNQQQSPTPSIYSFQSHQQPPTQPLPQVPQSFSSQSMKNIQMNDDNYSLHHHSSSSSASHSFNHQLQQQLQLQQQQQQQQQKQLRPYPNDNLLHRVQSLNQQLNYQNQQYFQQQHKYATMSNQTMAMSPDDVDFIDSNNHASYYVEDAKENHTKLPSQNAQTQVRYQNKMTSASSSNLNPMYYPSQSHTVGLGGFWTKTDNNERVWCTDNNKFPQSPQMSNAALKSNSLGNFDFQNMSPDSISISSGTSNENKKKEKIWRETSLDGPVQVKLKPPPIKLLNQQDIVNNNLHSPNLINNNNSPTPILYQQQQLQQQHIIMTNMYKHLSHRNSNNVPNIGDNLYYSPSEDQQQLKSTPPPPSDPNLMYYYPNLPPKSKLKHTESTRSAQSPHIDVSCNQFRDQENNNISMLSSPTLNGTIQTESPKNMGRIVQQGSWKPYKEETKAYEISDFYKYSTKFRQQK